MINPGELEAYLEETYGLRDALIVRDPESPAGFREWTGEDSERICRWVDGNGNPGGRQSGTQSPICHNLQEAARMAGVSTQTVQGWMRRRENPLPHMRDGRRIIIPHSLLVRWIEAEAMGLSLRGSPDPES